MAKNMTISVPDELHEAVQSVKGGFKTSATCQEALWKAVKIAQAIENEDVSALREKFDQERKKLFQSYYDEGFEDGRKDAFSFDFEKAQSFLEFIKKYGVDDTGTIEYHASVESDKKWKSYNEGDLPYSIETKYSDEEWVVVYAADAYYEGWVDGAQLLIRKALHGKDSS